MLRSILTDVAADVLNLRDARIARETPVLREARVAHETTVECELPEARNAPIVPGVPTVPVMRASLA